MTARKVFSRLSLTDLASLLYRLERESTSY